MELFTKVFFGLAVYLLGVATHIIYLKSRSKDDHRPVNPLPTKFPNISTEEKNILEIYQKEWQTIIQTQMHFNDLILRFRTVILTAFLTIISAAIAIAKLGNLQIKDFRYFLLLPFILWFTAFIIDLFYYHQMLIGSVVHALKFDNNDRFREIGMFGMTSTIKNKILLPASNLLVCIYYLVPGLLAVIAFLLLS